MLDLIARRGEEHAVKMSIIDHTVNNLDLLPLNLVYFVLENGNVLENYISLAVGTMQDYGFKASSYFVGNISPRRLALGHMIQVWSASRLNDTIQLDNLCTLERYFSLNLNHNVTCVHGLLLWGLTLQPYVPYLTIFHV